MVNTEYNYSSSSSPPSSPSQEAPDDVPVVNISTEEQKKLVESMDEDQKKLIAMQIISYQNFNLPVTEEIAEEDIRKIIEESGDNILWTLECAHYWANFRSANRSKFDKMVQQIKLSHTQNNQATNRIARINAQMNKTPPPQFTPPPSLPSPSAQPPQPQPQPQFTPPLPSPPPPSAQPQPPQPQPQPLPHHYAFCQLTPPPIFMEEIREDESENYEEYWNESSPSLSQELPADEDEAEIETHANPDDLKYKRELTMSESWYIATQLLINEGIPDNQIDDSLIRNKIANCHNSLLWEMDLVNNNRIRKEKQWNKFRAILHGSKSKSYV